MTLLLYQLFLLNLFWISNVIPSTDCFENSVPPVFVGVTVVFVVLGEPMLEPSGCLLRFPDAGVTGSSITCFWMLVFLYEVYEKEVMVP